MTALKCVWRDGCRKPEACAIKGHCDAPPTTCDCAETYPQLRAGTTAHGPGCRQFAAIDKVSAAQQECRHGIPRDQRCEICEEWGREPAHQPHVGKEWGAHRVLTDYNCPTCGAAPGALHHYRTSKDRSPRELLALVLKQHDTTMSSYISSTLIDDVRACLAITADETPREHPPELMAVVDKWQDYANALRNGQLPGYSTQCRAIEALLSEVRRTVAPQVKASARRDVFDDYQGCDSGLITDPARIDAEQFPEGRS